MIWIKEFNVHIYRQIVHHTVVPRFPVTKKMLPFVGVDEYAL